MAEEWDEYCRIYDQVAHNEQVTGKSDKEGRKQLQAAKQRLRAVMRKKPVPRAPDQHPHPNPKDGLQE